ncbi:MAG: hypothetical protein ACI9HK_000985 [Pirellulaceae bacterium]|jgi:hypothetical protein
MNQYRRIVDEIQNMIYAAAMVDRATVEPIAAEYRTVCISVNGRIRDIGLLLQRGLRSEAIHQAEIEPPLLDVVTILDFLELPQWLDLTTRLGIPRAPALLIDTAAELNDAYADEKPLENLLRTHRLLAIGRAPIAARIATLRKIAKFDFRNNVWNDDLKEYEAVRFVELRGEISLACKQNNLKALTALKSELDNSDWLCEPPHELIDYAQKQAGALFTDKSRERVADLARRLQAAMNALDFELAEQLIPKWQTCLQHARLNAADPSVMTAQRVLEWVEQERAAHAEQEEADYLRQREQSELDDFKAAVKGDVTEKKLLQRREQLRRAGVKIPKFLDGQYNERLKQLRRKRFIFYAAVAGGSVFAIALVFVLVWLIISSVNPS